MRRSGVLATGGVYAEANITGDVNVHAYGGKGVGVELVGQSGVFANITGNITTKSDDQAVGLDVYAVGGNASVHMTGVASATSYSYGAVGANIVANYANVTLGGASAVGATYATGVNVAASGDANVHVTGNVSALSGTGAAIGLQVYGDGASTYVGGDVASHLPATAPGV